MRRFRGVKLCRILGSSQIIKPYSSTYAAEMNNADKFTRTAIVSKFFNTVYENRGRLLSLFFFRTIRICIRNIDDNILLQPIPRISIYTCQLHGVGGRTNAYLHFSKTRPWREYIGIYLLILNVCFIN